MALRAPSTAETVLLAWLGNTDLRAAQDPSHTECGPVLMALQTEAYGRLVLLSDHGQPRTALYLSWLKDRFAGIVEDRHVTLRSPTNFEDIYDAANAAVAAVLSTTSVPDLTFHVSPGTPAMAAVWVLLAKAKYGARLIESSREHGVQPVIVPFDVAADFHPVTRRLADDSLARLVQGLPPTAPAFSSIIHRCNAMRRVIAMAQRLAQRDLPVLIQGESGTGKELFARAIHASSRRGEAPFVAVNCGAIAPDLVDAELFGHEKGAFTGAHGTRVGLFESADGGTLFLDEIGELPLASQVRLLRVLQEKEVTRLGANRPRKIDVRIISATNRMLPEEIRLGRFREDVYYRIAVGVLALPPLRDREGDLSLLINELLDRINRDAATQPGYRNKKLSVGARKLMIGYAWPGNVRELYNTLLRASIWTPDEEISTEDVAEALALSARQPALAILDRTLGGTFSLPELVGEVARHYLEKALVQSQGNKTEAAALLGLASYQTLSNWLAKYKINGVGTDRA